MTTVRIPCSGVQVFPPDPQGVTTTIGFAYGRSLPALPGDPNARTPSPKSPAARAMSAKLTAGPQSEEHRLFLHANTGITILAQSATSYTEGSESGVEITLVDGDGIVDGGHTHSMIRHHLSYLASSDLQVMLRIMTGSLSATQRVAISQGRNTSKAVRPESIFNLKGGFDSLKAHLGEYAEDISYQENASGVESAASVARSVLCLLGVRWGETVTSVYHSNTGVVLRFLTQEATQEKVRSFSAMAPLLRLRDEIRLDLVNTVPDAHTHARVFTRAKKPLAFLGRKESFVAAPTWTLPILASLSLLVTEGTGRWGTKETEQARDIWDRCKYAVGQVFAEYVARGADSSLKDSQFWADVHVALGGKASDL